MEPSWLQELEQGGYDGTIENDLMQYLDMPDADSVDHEELMFSESASVKSEFSEHPSPYDGGQASPWSEVHGNSPQDEQQGHWKTTGDFHADYSTAQRLLQGLSFGRTVQLPLAPGLPSAGLDYAEVLGQHGPSPYKYQLFFGELPSRSRVETQIKCSLIFVPPPEEHLLHLPTDTMTRPRFQLRDEYVPTPMTLSLEIDAVVPEKPREPVSMCGKCIAREKKRAFRKKTLDMNEENHWNEGRMRRVAVLNCKEVVALPLPKQERLPNGEMAMVRQVDLPLRLACYCRHHAAKSGYQLVFTVRDWHGEIVAQAVSDSIFVTDNHKETRSLVPTSSGSRNSGLSDTSASSMLLSSMDSSSDHSMSSRRGSRSSYHPYARRSSQWDRRVGTVPSTPSSNPPFGLSSASAPNSDGNASSVFGASKGLAPVGLDSMSRVSGANQSGNHVAEPRVTNIVVQRAIPAQGSIRGGVEVTLLGQGFYPGLVAMFGDNPAISTQCWSDNTLISHLPPSNVGGPVTVSFQGIDAHPQSASFTYINDSEAKLVELALQVVGFKMNGKIEDASDVASRIVNSEYQSGDGQDGPEVKSESPEQVVLRCLEFVRTASKGPIVNLNLRNTEGQTMMHLACILGYHDVVLALMAQGAHVDMQDVSGMTPLHFTALFGNRAITRQLLQAHADPFHCHYGGKTVIEMADSTVSDILPKDQRSYYQSLNASSSSSTLASVLSREDLLPVFADSPANQLPLLQCNSSREDFGLDTGNDEEGVVSTVKRLREKQSGSHLTEHGTDLFNFVYRVLGIPRDSREWGREWGLRRRYEKPPEYDEIYPVSSGQVERSGSKSRRSRTGSRKVIEIPVSDTDDEERADDDDELLGAHPTEEQVIETWATSPLKQIKNDHMLFTFWIPLLVMALCYVLSLFINFGDASSFLRLNVTGRLHV